MYFKYSASNLKRCCALMKLGQLKGRKPVSTGDASEYRGASIFYILVELESFQNCPSGFHKQENVIV